MNSVTGPRQQLLDTLLADPGLRPDSLETGTDNTLGIGQDVVRLVWHDETATAVAANADLSTSCGALVDAVLIQRTRAAAATDLRPAVHVLVHRAPPDAARPSETDQALRSMRDAVSGLQIRLWYRERDRWVEDLQPAPEFASDQRVSGWVSQLLLPRLLASPTPLAHALLHEVDDPSLGLYASEIKLGVEPRWSLRLDGLEIGTVGESSGTLTVGGKAKDGEGPQRSAFLAVAGVTEVEFTQDGAGGTVTVEDAAELIRKLMRHWRGHPVAGAPVTHRSPGGVPFVDEHALESRLLKGLVRPTGLGSETGLVLDDEEVARGSQFPTLWGRGANPRYLDALITSGRVPLAVELKVATGGQGRYYRRALTQAVLYRHFILHAPQLDRWFQEAGLDRMSVRACVGIPMPTKWSGSFEAMLERLRRTAEAFDVDVLLLDDRQTPDREPKEDLPDPSPESVEHLSLRLAGELSRRWPVQLGRLVQRHDRGGGQYDELILQALQDRNWGQPSRGPRISVNRQGSLWIWNSRGDRRWTWRGIWSELQDGITVGEAAVLVGAMAGLPNEKALVPATIGSLATTFLDAVSDREVWMWRCALCPGDDPLDLSAFGKAFGRYARSAAGDRIPTVARIWCALQHGVPRVAVDQENLRVWIATSDGPRELDDGDPTDRVRSAASILGDQEKTVGD